MSAAPSRIGLLGKVPRQADFLRLNASSALALHLHRWLEAAVASGGGKGPVPAGPACFLFTVPGEKSALVGALAPSEDSVGRTFPLAVFTEAPAATLASRLALLPAAFGSFLGAGAELLQQAPALEVEELAQRVAALPLLHQGDFNLAEQSRKSLLQERSGAELLQPVLQGEPPEARYYALHTFLTACAGERHREQSAASVILECPLDPGLGPLPWLELAAQRLRWSAAPPAIVWSLGDRPRLLISLGAATAPLLVHLAWPDRAGPQLWSLRTTRAAAHASARQALSAAQRQALDSLQIPLGELLRALSR